MPIVDRKMKLIEYLEESKKQEFNSKRLAHFEDNCFLCEIHERDLLVADGFTIVYCELFWDIDSEIFSQNPNAIWMYESIEKPKGFQSEPAKVVYCPTCESNRQAWAQAKRARTKKVKGQKSKKYKETNA